jgi:TRAP-type C4-dicarboxylate transport system permease small subunit
MGKGVETMRAITLSLLDIAVKVTRWLTIVAAVCIAFLMFVNFFDIIGSKFFLKSVPGALDISEELMVCLTLLPISYVALERGHIRITLLEERLSPRVQFILRILQYLIATLITGFITWRVFVQFEKTLRIMQLKEGIDLPIWPGNLAVTISFGVLTLVWALLLIKTVVEGVEKQS